MKINTKIKGGDRTGCNPPPSGPRLPPGQYLP